MSAVDSIRSWAKARGADPFTPGQCFDALDDVEDRQQVYAAINTLYTKEKVLSRRKKGTGNEYVWHEFAGHDFESVPTTEQLVGKGLIPPPAARPAKSKTPARQPPMTPSGEARSLAAQILAQGKEQQTIHPSAPGHEIPEFLRKAGANGDDDPEGIYAADPAGSDAAPPEIQLKDPAGKTVADAVANAIAKTIVTGTAARVEGFPGRSAVRITIERIEITLEGVL